MTRFVGFSVPFVLLSVCAYGQSSTQSNLSCLNYWDLTQRLIGSDRLRYDLEVSPEQMDKLRALQLAGSELSLIVELRCRQTENAERYHRAEQNARGEVVDDRVPSEETRRRILTELEPTIKKRLLRILENQQLENLRRIALREKYGNGYSPFLSREVEQHCGFEPTSLLEIVEKERLTLEKLIPEAALASVRRLMEKLPLAARKKFTCYMGPEKFPSVQISSELLAEITSAELPVPGNYGLIDLLADDPPTQVSVGVTAAQIEAFKRLRDNLELETHDMFEFKMPPPPRNMDKFNQSYVAVNMKFKALSEKVLDRSQLLRVNQIIAYGESQWDPSTAFERPEFIAFLGLTPDEQKASKIAAHEERVKLHGQYTSFRKSCFLAISKEIDQKPRDRLLGLFEGVFD